MTINEVTNQLYDLSVGGYFNGEKFTRIQLHNYLKWATGISNRWVMQIALPDGWWFMSVSRFNNGEYGYFIPEDREKEYRLKETIGA